MRVGLLIFEDGWFEEPARLGRDAGALMLAVSNASPFCGGKRAERIARMAACAQSVRLPLAWARLAGWQDEVVFDGDSFLLQSDGSLAMQADNFKKNMLLAVVLSTSLALKFVVKTPGAESENVALPEPSA